MSLTESEIKAIRESWAPVYANPESNGALILKTFLDKYDYYSNFERFQDFPRENVMDNIIFRNHCLKLMHTMNAGIINLEDPVFLKEHFKELGKGHKKRKIKGHQFDELKLVILDILKDTFEISDEAHQAWIKMFVVTMPFIRQGLGNRINREISRNIREKR